MLLIRIINFFFSFSFSFIAYYYPFGHCKPLIISVFVRGYRSSRTHTEIINWDRFDSVAWLVIFHSFIFQLTIPNGTHASHLISTFHFESHWTFRRFFLLVFITKMENGILNRILSLVSMNKTEVQPTMIPMQTDNQLMWIMIHHFYSCTLFLWSKRIESH